MLTWESFIFFHKEGEPWAFPKAGLNILPNQRIFSILNYFEIMVHYDNAIIAKFVPNRIFGKLLAESAKTNASGHP